MATPTQDLKVSEAATVLNCSANTVRRLAKSGTLRGYKLGERDWRFTPAAVNELRQRRSGQLIPESAAPTSRATPSRRGAQLPGWYDYDHGGQPS